MAIILAGVHTSDQHFSRLISSPGDYRPSHCLHCNRSCLWCHGFYTRLAGCESNAGPLLMPRYRCAYCGKTCSVLPEFAAPKRWFHWATQQVALTLLLSGLSYHAVLDILHERLEHPPSRSTLQRWWARFRGDQSVAQFILCDAFPTLGLAQSLTDFWSRCLSQWRLSSVMVRLFRAQAQGHAKLCY